MNDLKTAALKVAALKALSDRIAEAANTARAELLPELLAAHDDLGLKSIDVSLPGGAKVATVPLTQPKGAYVVTDRSAFESYAESCNAVETITTTHVNPAWEKATLASCQLHAGDNITTPDGELVPGVEWREAGPITTFSVRFETGGREAIAEAFARGELEAVVPLALPNPKGETCESE